MSRKLGESWHLSLLLLCRIPEKGGIHALNGPWKDTKERKHFSFTSERIQNQSWARKTKCKQFLYSHCYIVQKAASWHIMSYANSMTNAEFPMVMRNRRQNEGDKEYGFCSCQNDFKSFFFFNQLAEYNFVQNS